MSKESQNRYQTLLSLVWKLTQKYSLLTLLTSPYSYKRISTLCNVTERVFFFINREGRAVQLVITSSWVSLSTLPIQDKDLTKFISQDFMGKGWGNWGGSASRRKSSRETLWQPSSKRIYEKHEDMFSKVCCARTSSDGFNLKEGKFRVDKRMKFCTMKVVRHWHRCEFPTLEIFKVWLELQEKGKKQCKHVRTLEEQEITPIISHKQGQKPILKCAAVCPAVQLTCLPSPSTSWASSWAASRWEGPACAWSNPQLPAPLTTEEPGR